MHRDLVERAMAGDHDAFSELARGSVTKLYAIARLIVRDSDQAEDATQEALVAAWKQLRSLRDPDRFDAWLRRLLVRACYREADKRQHWRHLEAQIQPFLSDVPDPGIAIADRDELEQRIPSTLTPAAGTDRAALLLGTADAGDRRDRRPPSGHREVPALPCDPADARGARRRCAPAAHRRRHALSSPFDFDRRLTAWLEGQAPTHEPEDLADEALSRSRRTRQSPGWATLERWIPMETRYRLGAVPKTALILTMLVLLLALFSAIAIGQQPSPKLPPPFGAARNGLIAFDDGGDIFVVNPDGTGRKALTSGPELDTAPEWSQDGTQIAFFSQQKANGLAAIKVMDADGQHTRTVADGVWIPPVSWHVSWSHDGRSLAYADRHIDGLTAVDGIMVVPVAGGDPVKVVSPGQAPTWSPDDRTIAYQSGGGTKDGTTVPQGLSVIGVDGNGQRLIDGSATSNPWAYAYPQWSSDGARVAYHTGLPGHVSNVFVAAVDGSGTAAIGDPAQNLVWPVWAPDDARIAYVGALAAAGPYQISLVAPDGSDANVLDHPPLACNCAFRWSPDGTKVIAWMDGPVENGSPTSESLMIADVAGGEPVRTIELTTLIGSDMSWQRLAP